VVGLVVRTPIADGYRQPMVTRQQRRRRRSAEEGRRELLEAGRDYVYERPLGEPLDHVKVSDIVDRLGVSSGAVYHYWESQDAYRDDLIDLLLSPDQFPNAQRAAEAVGAAWGEDPAFEEMARVVADISYHGLELTADRERLTLALIAHGDQDINDRLGNQANGISARWAQLFSRYFPAYGLEPRPPFTFESMAVVLMAMVEGMHLRRTITPDVVTGDLAPGWDLFASAALAFVVGATRPVEAEDDPADGERTVWDLVRRIVPNHTPTKHP
jgi:AcrR family transcriptional regulator